MQLPANSVKGKITQNKIQCSFLAALPLGALRAEDNVAMSLSTGDYDAGKVTFMDIPTVLDMVSAEKRPFH